MSSSRESREGTGPSWGDVADLIAHLEVEHRCRIVLEMTRSSSHKRGLKLDLIARRVRGRNDWYTCLAEGSYWPTTLARTIPALLVQKLWKLSDGLHDYDDLPMFRDQMPQGTLPPPPSGD